MGDSAATSGVEGGGKGGAASVLSIGSAGLKAYGDYEAGVGKSEGMKYRAATLENNARRGRVSAAQTGAAESMQLAQTLGNIDAVRAAAHGDPTSPMAGAYRDSQEELGLSKKAIDVDNIMAQAQQDETDALYMRSSAKYALQAGEVAAGSDILSALAKAI